MIYEQFVVNYLPSFNSARYTQRIIQTVKSREVEKISRPEEIYHDTGPGILFFVGNFGYSTVRRG